MKKNVRSSKYDPLVQEVELLSANPNYAHVRFPNGRSTTVSLKQLAPKPDENIFGTTQSEYSNLDTSENNITLPDSSSYSESSPYPESIDKSPVNSMYPEIPDNTLENANVSPEITQNLRRSVRIKKPVKRLDL